ncbi:MAG: hypothetical protein EXS31_08620 [Pedosphaera sp.]|nr:hypothetical protein [Pedosphaera sp.]
MTISGHTPSSLIDAASNTSDPMTNQIAVRMLEKAQDQIKLEGAATLKLIDSAGVQPGDYQRLDVYA